MNYEPPPDPSEITWKIEREGRAWGTDDALPRYELTPEKIEMVKGKLFWSDEHRLRMLGLLLENCGADAAVRLGDPDVWRRAVASLDDPEAALRHELAAAHRRWDNGQNDPAGLIRFYEQITTSDFVEQLGTAPARAREQVLAELRQAREAAGPTSGPHDYTNVETHLDAVHIADAGDQARVSLTRTLCHHRWEKADGSGWRSLPEVVEVERWREIWMRTGACWRLSRRERIEGPWIVTNERMETGRNNGR
jgi:hypothetical protein